MAKSDAWFGRWVVKHIAQNPRPDWPAPGSEYWAGLQTTFLRHGVTETVANEATLDMHATGLDYLSNHTPRLLEIIKHIWASSEVSGSCPADRDSAAEQSRGCIDCGGGTGLTIRYRHGSLTKTSGRTITLYCDCPLGRWTERSHSEKAKDIHKRVYDLLAPEMEFLRLRPEEWSNKLDNPWCYPPAAWDHKNNRPIKGPEKLSDLLPKKRVKTDPTLVETFTP